MIFRHRFRDPKTMIGVGSFCLAAGIIAQRFIHPPTDFWQGFVWGVSGSLIGLSIVFNLRGLVLHRARRNHGES